MATLDTTINLNSTNSLPFSINQTAKSSGKIGNFVESGVKTISEFNFSEYESRNENLSTKNCGPNGAYVFVSNPSTNTATVKLYLSGMGGERYETAFATLKPGDSTLVPLTAQQLGVYAATTFGTCSIDYYIADRGGEFGISALTLINNGNWKYKIFDAELAEVLPYTSDSTTKSDPVDLGLSTSDWYLNSIQIINNKGYLLMFYNSVNGNYMSTYINSYGEYNNQEYISYNPNTYAFINGYAVVDASSSPNILVHYYDGDDNYDLTFIGSEYNIRSDWGYSSADGSFIIDIYDYNGVSGDIATILVNKNLYYVLSLLNPSTPPYFYTDTAAVYYYGNFVFIAIYNNNNGVYKEIKIYNIQGVLLQDIDLSNYSLYYLDYAFYGTNKIQIILNDDNVTNYMLNYNGTTNKLLGYNSNKQLTWSHTIYDGTYNDYLFYAYSKNINDSIRPYPYIWNSGMFDAESMAIVYVDQYYTDGYDFINSRLGYCDIVYVMDGATSPSTYTFANDQNKFIKIPYESDYSRVVPSSKQITFSYSTGNETSGSLNALILSSTSVTTSSIADLSVINTYDFYHGSGTGITFKPVGDYMMYTFYNPNNNTTTYTMLKSATVKDSVNILGQQQYPGVWRTRINSLLLRSWNYNSPRNWYFNTSTNKFVELTAGGSSFNASKPYYPQHYWNESSTTNGLNDGNLLIGPSSGNPIGFPYSGNSTVYGYNNNMRMLKKGVVTGNVTLPTTDGYWQLKLGSEAVFFIYQDMNDNYNAYLKIYDLDLNLKNTIKLSFDNNYNTSSNTVYSLQVIGKRSFILSYDEIGNRYYMMVSLNGVAYWVNDESTYNSPFFNDQWWFNYEY